MGSPERDNYGLFFQVHASEELSQFNTVPFFQICHTVDKMPFTLSPKDFCWLPVPMYSSWGGLRLKPPLNTVPIRWMEKDLSRLQLGFGGLTPTWSKMGLNWNSKWTEQLYPSKPTFKETQRLDRHHNANLPKTLYNESVWRWGPRPCMALEGPLCFYPRSH